MSFKPDGRKTIATYAVSVKNIFSEQCWGYYKVCGNRVFVHLKICSTEKIPDWASLTNAGSIPSSITTFVIAANGKNGTPNSIYIFTTGVISQAGGGGMPAGEYEFDFDYQKV